MSEVLAWARRWARRPGAADHELLEIGSSATAESVRAAYHKLARFAHPDLHRATVSAEELEEITDAFARVSNAYSVMMARLRKAAEKEAEKEAEAAQGGEGGRREARDERSGRVTRPGNSVGASVRSAANRQAQGTAPIPPLASAQPARSEKPPASPSAVGTGRVPVVQFTSKGATRPPPAGAAPGVSGSTTTPTAIGARPAAGPSAAASVASDGPAISLSAKGMMHYRRAELCLRRGEIVEARLHLKLAMASDPQSTFLRKAFDDLDRR